MWQTVEISKLELGNGEKHNSIVASTIRELQGVLPLVATGVVKDALYGVPPAKSKISILEGIARQMVAYNAKLRLMIDSIDQLNMLKDYSTKNPGIPAWSIFLKVDIGDHRAGQEATSATFDSLVKEIITTTDKYVELHGVYVHRGSSYGSAGVYDAQAHLKLEVEGVKAAASVVRKYSSSRYVLSMGATPTAHIVSSEVKSWMKDLQTYGEVEIHAGNYALLDIQQVATGLVSPSDIAGKVVAEVLSYYADRDEYLIDAGVLALAREPGRIPGIAIVEGQPMSGSRWVLNRVSQEHGILGRRTDAVDGFMSADSIESVDPKWEIGDKIVLLPQHACITSSMYQWYFAVENGVVDEILLPWRGW